MLLEAQPRLMIKNPVMFVTMVGAALTTVGFSPRGPIAASSRNWRSGCGLPSCLPILPKRWPKAEAKPGPGLAETRVQTKTRRIGRNGQLEEVSATELRKGDVVLVRATETIPADGDVIEGAATVDESAITGGSAPVIRESGGDRSAVTGGTRVLSDEIKSPRLRQSWRRILDRMISLVEGARRQKTPNEIALTILLAALTVIFLLVCVTLKPFGIYSSAVFSVPVLIALWSA